MNFSVRNTNMVDDFERKSVIRKRKILLHKRLRQRSLFYAFCLTLKFVQIHSVEPTVFYYCCTSVYTKFIHVLISTYTILPSVLLSFFVSP